MNSSLSNKKKYYVRVCCLLIFMVYGCAHLSYDKSFVHSKQFDSERKIFKNSNGEIHEKNILDLFGLARSFFNRKFDPLEDEGFPMKDNRHLFEKKRFFTWIGHSTVLLKYDGVTVLTDPIFSERASPFSFLGPKRVVRPAYLLRDLPKINYVVISHNHYDHLDIKTLKFIARINPNLVIFVPLGVKDHLSELDCIVEEYDWWESKRFGAVKFTATPAHHWSARTIFDKNRSLWSGWMISWPDFKFYFVGDTGYSNDFKEIKKKLGPPDLAAIPIGAYAPRTFMKNFHVNPEEAVKIFKDVGAKQALGIHWGTFKLSTEKLGEPPELLKQVLKQKKYKSIRSFKTYPHGTTILLKE